MTQCSTLWMSHCREKEWDGADCSLQYSASLSEVSCSTVLWISTSVSTAQLLQQSLHQVLAGRPLSQIFSNQKKIAIPDVHLDHPPKKCSKIHPIFHPKVHPVSPKIHRQSSSSSSWGVHPYLCHLWFKVKRERSVPYMSPVQYNGTMWSEITENNPHWESTEAIQLVWLWDNVVIPQCHLID